MHMQNDIAAAAADGPHFHAPSIDPAVRRAEIDHILAAANTALPAAVRKKLGALSFAKADADDDAAYFPQIRSEPFGASACEFRYPIPARDTGKQGLDRHIAEIVEDAWIVAKDSVRFGKWAATLRETAERIIEEATGGMMPMRIVAVGVTPRLPHDRIDGTVDVQMLGCDLKPGIERVTADTVERAGAKLAELVQKHLSRRKTLAQAMVQGVSGWFDDAALRVMDAVGLDRAQVVEMMTTTHTRRELGFSFGGDKGRDVEASLFWVDGTITCFAECRARGRLFRLDAERLTIEREGLPDTLIAALPGRRLRDVVDLDLVPRNAVIVDVADAGLLYLTLERGRTAIETAVPAAR